MLERIIENWLDKATELSYQQPFCYMLSAEGYTIIHSTRHSAMELGVDIIAIAPDGKNCAFQLKTGNISLAKWRSEVSSQIEDLVCGQINHPSVDVSEHHISYLVTNGRIEEEVIRAIDDRNRAWASQGQSYCLETIVGGQLLERAKRLGTDLLPSELTDVKTLLEMFLENGEGTLPKEKLASLFESTFPLKHLKNGKKPTKKHCERVIASAGLLCAIAISNFSKENNHVAEIEAWTLYIAYVFALVERWDLSIKAYKNELKIATQSIYDSLANLCDEVKERDDLIEGDLFADSYVYRVRMTWLLGLMSIYALWRHSKEEPTSEIDDFLSEFCKDKQHLLELWGEAAIPQFLAFLWYFRRINATMGPTIFLHHLISAICQRNGPNSRTFLANPYYEADNILPHILAPILGPGEDPLEETFIGSSYALEGLVHLFIRTPWKQTMKRLWPGISKLASISYKPENSWDFYRWMNKKEGKIYDVYPKPMQEWNDLKALSFESEGACIPPTIKEHPILLLLFLCVYPHRMNAEIMRWLDTQMQQIPRP